MCEFDVPGGLDDTWVARLASVVHEIYTPLDINYRTRELNARTAENALLMEYISRLLNE